MNPRLDRAVSQRIQTIRPDISVAALVTAALVPAVWLRSESYSRRQSVHAHLMENQRRFFRGHHSSDRTDARWVSLARYRIWLATFRWREVRSVGATSGSASPQQRYQKLASARDGRLWIGTFSELVSWKDRELTHYPELDGQTIEALLEDREGTIWVAVWALSTGRLCSIQNGNIQCYGEDGRFASSVSPLYEDSGGNL